MDSYIYIIDDLTFFLTGILFLYLFILSTASHFRHITYPKAQKKYRCAILIRESSLLPNLYGKESPYEFITYNDLYQGINSLDKEHYDLALILPDTARTLSPQLLDKIYDAYDAGIQAIQLHTLVKGCKGFRFKFRVMRDEIKNTCTGQAIRNSGYHPICLEPIWLLIWHGYRKT